MSRVSRVVHQFLLSLLLACGIAVIAFLPSRERIGLTVERLAAWWSPPKPRAIQIAQLGPAKRGFFERLAAVRLARESALATRDNGRGDGPTPRGAAHDPAPPWHSNRRCQSHQGGRSSSIRPWESFTISPPSQDRRSPAPGSSPISSIR